MKIITFDDIHQKEYYNKLCYEFISKYKNRKLISIVKPIIDEDIEGITDYNAAIVDRSGNVSILFLFNSDITDGEPNTAELNIHINTFNLLASDQPDGVLISTYFEFDESKKIIYLFEYSHNNDIDVDKYIESVR